MGFVPSGVEERGAMLGDAEGEGEGVCDREDFPEDVLLFFFPLSFFPLLGEGGRSSGCFLK